MDRSAYQETKNEGIQVQVSALDVNNTESDKYASLALNKDIQLNLETLSSPMGQRGQGSETNIESVTGRDNPTGIGAAEADMDHDEYGSS